MRAFKEDFYEEIHSMAIVAYLGPEKNFDSLAPLISVTREIEETTKWLDLPEYLHNSRMNISSRFLKNKIMNGHGWKMTLFLHPLFPSISLFISYVVSSWLYFKRQAFFYSCELNNMM